MENESTLKRSSVQDAGRKLAKTLYIDSTERKKKSLRLNSFSLTTEGDLLIAIDKLLKKANVSLKEIKNIKVKRGPGSFTSLRTGISIANALSYALALKDLKDLDVPEYDKEPSITIPKDSS